MAHQRNFVIELFWKWHPRLYRWSGGRIGGKLAGLPVLLLETVGRRSGERRETALTYLPHPHPDGENFVVIASVLGEPRHPAWYLNLRADPKVAVTAGRSRIAVVARDAEGEEREQIWNDLVTISPDYAQYRTRTDRRIPVVVLERRRR
ncbi:MAG: nitroreductase family deazaflavin-dependent oxidoreductase [bacterium]|nr:nitroreductase family deazaflavin-dependent oxidoreductase [bacterium]